MNQQTYSESNPSDLLKTISGSYTVNSNGADNGTITVPHNLSRYPAIRMFWKNSYNNNIHHFILGEFNGSSQIYTVAMAYTRVTPSMDATNVYLEWSNANGTPGVITIYYIIYAERTAT